MQPFQESSTYRDHLKLQPPNCQLGPCRGGGGGGKGDWPGKGGERRGKRWELWMELGGGQSRVMSVVSAAALVVVALRVLAAHPPTPGLLGRVVSRGLAARSPRLSALLRLLLLPQPPSPTPPAAPSLPLLSTLSSSPTSTLPLHPYSLFFSPKIQI